MAVYGYFRISTESKDNERKILALEKAGCDLIRGDKIKEKSNYGDSPELSKLLGELQENDLLILEELSRLGRTMATMLVQTNKLIERGVFIKTLDGRLDTSLMNDEIVRLIVGIMGYASECELRNIRHRASQGRRIAKSKGVKFGAKRKFNKQKIQEIMDKRKEGMGYGSIAKELRMKKSTIQAIIQRELLAN